MNQIDTRGLSCPQPVVLVLNEIRSGKSEFEVLLDSEASRENVKRLLNKNKLKFEVKENLDHTIYHVKR
ncbi:MAG: sulfurtransferase TusA family protein [Candidatus Cloacimonetes bacterium]|nr:sulfurtransferase TusA family protein [Candidatus Cloacimonadota bacterium]